LLFPVIRGSIDAGVKREIATGMALAAALRDRKRGDADETHDRCSHLGALGRARAGINELLNWQLTMVLISDEISRTVALGWMDPKRMAAGYDLVERYFGLEQKFDVATAFTNEFLDQSIKMRAVEEPKFN
jgi:hypothetical protein